jgi:hypothetical protein
MVFQIDKYDKLTELVDENTPTYRVVVVDPCSVMDWIPGQ